MCEVKTGSDNRGKGLMGENGTHRVPVLESSSTSEALGNIQERLTHTHTATTRKEEEKLRGEDGRTSEGFQEKVGGSWG